MPGTPVSRNTRLALLEARLQAFRAEVLKWQLSHLRYHGANESRWGIVGLMRAHPFRTLAVGAAVGAAVIGGLGGGGLARGLIQQLVRWLWS